MKYYFKPRLQDINTIKKKKLKNTNLDISLVQKSEKPLTYVAY